jgi:ferredoxin
MEYTREELQLKVFRDFPADTNDAVCASAAIAWPLESSAPVVDSDSCILCGLCVGRCPTRAIHLDAQGAHVNDQPNSHFLVQGQWATPDSLAATSKLFQNVLESGVYLSESDALLVHFRQRFEGVSRGQSAQFPNHLARNLLIATGIGAAMRRRGDTNIRMDLVLGPPGVPHGTGEVELGSGVVEAPRNILDNVAVLVARYEIAKDETVPLVVSLDLPNRRSEYWQVINDTFEVLDVRINSITIGLLVVLVWNRACITIQKGADLYIDANSSSLRPQIEAILRRKLNVTAEAYPGFAEPAK